MEKNTSFALITIVVLGLLVFGASFFVSYRLRDDSSVTPNPANQALPARVYRIGAAPGSKCEYKTPENTFTDIEQALQRPQDVCFLVLKNKRLTELPASISSLTEVVYIDANGNELSSLPSEIAQLPNLEHIMLSGNKFTTVPPVLLSMKTIKRIDLVQNPLPPQEQQRTRASLPNTTLYFN